MRQTGSCGRPFPTTHWSEVEHAGQEAALGTRPLLGELLTRYMPAMRAHVRIRLRTSSEHAEEVVQGFISSKVLSSGLLNRADRSRGRFRTFLLTALDRYAISEQRREHAQKRGRSRTGSLDAAAFEPATDLPAGDAFDIEWSRQILREAIRRMQAHCESEGRLDVWGVFQSRVLRPALFGERPAEYQQIVSQYAYRSPTQLWNAVRSGKHLFARMLRDVICEYTDSPQEVEAELSDLRRICAGGRAQERAQDAYP